jgi:hypothetical protein
MDVLALGGSIGGGSRTASSVLLAAGARELGLHPLHTEVLPFGRAPSLDHVQQVPFDTALTPADDWELVANQIRLLVQRKPECFPVIVDMLCKWFRTTMLILIGSRARILLSMWDGAGKLADCPQASLTSIDPACDGRRSSRVKSNPFK